MVSEDDSHGHQRKIRVLRAAMVSKKSSADDVARYSCCLGSMRSRLMPNPLPVYLDDDASTVYDKTTPIVSYDMHANDAKAGQRHECTVCMAMSR